MANHETAAPEEAPERQDDADAAAETEIEPLSDVVTPTISIGRIVHFRIDEETHVPAIITADRGNGRVDLRVFATPLHTPFAYGARVQSDAGGYYAEDRREGDEIGTWRWPVIDEALHLSEPDPDEDD